MQQNSDVIFRLFDWGRAGLDGKPRELHVERAVRAVGGKAISVRKARPRPLRKSAFPAERLSSCGKFVMDHWSVRRAARRRKRANFEILHVAEGGGVLRDSRRSSRRPFGHEPVESLRAERLKAEWLKAERLSTGWPAIRLTRGATILVLACVDECQILAARRPGRASRLVIVRMAEPE